MSALPEYTLAEVAQHRTRESCWVVLAGSVYDFTAFIDEHPGGARGLLRHAGSDASEVFAELHSQSIFAAFGPDHLIGTLAAADGATPRAWQGVNPEPRGMDGIGAAGGLAEVSPSAAVLPSAFPHDAFTGSGLETFRFHWTVADRLLRLEDVADGGSSVAPAPGPPTQHVHRQKSNLGVLDAERDWLHVGLPDVYASEMRLKRQLYLEHSDKVYVTDAGSVAAEQEVLEEVIEWLMRRYPTRFEVVRDGGGRVETVLTTTVGYAHSFALSDWSDRPLVLVGLLVQVIPTPSHVLDRISPILTPGVRNAWEGGLLFARRGRCGGGARAAARRR